MTLTKQQKILAAIAVLGVGVVAVDRLLLGPPESASASVAPANDPAGTPPEGSAGAAATADTPAQADAPALPSFETLTQRLAESATDRDAHAGQDPFRLPEDWTPKAVQALQPIQAVKSVSSELLPEQYKLDGTFRSVIEQDQEHIAVINGRAMRVGDRIVVRTGTASDGTETGEVYVLSQVGARAVVFESVQTGLQVVLRAPKVIP
ncbi:MAG: hypothetical protein ACE37H_07240 [Phycisphaeraceae bacterium]